MKVSVSRCLIQICLLGMVLLPAIESGAQPVTQIAAGDTHTLFLKSDGSLWGMGANVSGQLGDRTFNNTNRPEQIVASNVVAIAAGGNHSLFIKSDGSLWAMGYNAYGELGDGTFATNQPAYGTNQPEQIVASNVVAIAAGENHSLFIKRDGSLWAMGNNDSGQLGDGTYNTTNLPEQIVASNVTAVAAGGFHSLFRMSNGSLWAMGDNQNGQLGDSTFTPDVAIREQVVSNGVVMIAGGDNHSLFIKDDGSLWAMGNNNIGQLGDGNYSYPPGINVPEQIIGSNVVAIAAGQSHSLLLKLDGSLWATGDDFFGQLCAGAYDQYPYATNLFVQIVTSRVMAIAAGALHSLFLKSDGSLWAMGNNNEGQLGDGFYSFGTNQPEQILAPYNQISGQLLTNGDMQLSFAGIAAANYALDRASSLSPPNWTSQATNPATSYGALVFTNTPDPATNNFWRIRSVP